jgi:hypothetical protein
MTARELEDLKKKLELAKQKKAKMEGAIESIVEKWQNEYGFSTVDEAQAFLLSLESKVEKLQKKETFLVNSLDELVDWDTL